MKIKQQIKVLIIEDDVSWALYIESILSESYFTVVGTASTIRNAKSLIDSFNPDLIIADIKLLDGSIFNLMNEEKYRHFPVIFMTNHTEDDFFNKTLKLPKSTFLAKPFHKFTLLSTIELFISKYPIAQENNKYIDIMGRNHQHSKLSLDNITWLMADGNYSYIYTRNKQKFIRKKSLKKTMAELDSRFLQVNKSYIINLRYIQRIDFAKNIILLNETEIPIGEKYRKALEQNIEPKLI